MNKDRYDLDKLPIRDEVRERIKNQTLAEMAAIELIHTIMRGQLVQDEYIEELIKEVLKEIKLLRKDVKKQYNDIEKRVEVLEGKVA